MTRCCHIIPMYVFLAVLTFLATDTFGQTENSADAPSASTQSATSTIPDRGEPQGAGQNSAYVPPTCGITHVGQCLKDLGHDQGGIWTSPLRIRSHDAYWLVPFAAATGVSLHYDAQTQQNLGIDKTRIDISNTISDVGLYGSIGGAAGLYLLGSATTAPCRAGAFGRRSDSDRRIPAGPAGAALAGPGNETAPLSDDAAGAGWFCDVGLC